MPVLYKHAVDALGQGAPGAVAVPLGLILAYGGARVLSLIFSELRDAIFARVGQHAIRASGCRSSATCMGWRCAFTWRARPAG